MNRINPHYRPPKNPADRFRKPWTPSGDLQRKAAEMVRRVYGKIAQRERERAKGEAGK